MTDASVFPAAPHGRRPVRRRDGGRVSGRRAAALAEAGVKIDRRRRPRRRRADRALRRDRRRRAPVGRRRARGRDRGSARAYRWRAALRFGAAGAARRRRCSRLAAPGARLGGASCTPRACSPRSSNLPDAVGVAGRHVSRDARVAVQPADPADDRAARCSCWRCSSSLGVLVVGRGAGGVAGAIAPAAVAARSGGGWSARRSTPTSRPRRWWTRSGGSCAARPTRRGRRRRRSAAGTSTCSTDNLGQPGFREVLVARPRPRRAPRSGRRVALARGAQPRSRRAATAPGRARPRSSTSPGRSATWSSTFCMGALRLPVATAPHLVQFPADSYWRGELHRVCDRPELAVRLVDESAAVGVEQVILVSAAPPPAAPHGLRGRPADLRGRMGEVVRSIETAAFQDAWTAAASALLRRLRHPAGSQPDRTVRLRRRLRRGVRPPAHGAPS